MWPLKWFSEVSPEFPTARLSSINQMRLGRKQVREAKLKNSNWRPRPLLHLVAFPNRHSSFASLKRGNAHQRIGKNDLEKRRVFDKRYLKCFSLSAPCISLRPFKFYELKKKINQFSAVCAHINDALLKSGIRF